MGLLDVILEKIELPGGVTVAEVIKYIATEKSLVLLLEKKDGDFSDAVVENIIATIMVIIAKQIGNVRNNKKLNLFNIKKLK